MVFDPNYSRICHPELSGGRAARDHRLISCTPPACGTVKGYLRTARLRAADDANPIRVESVSAAVPGSSVRILIASPET